MIRVAHSPVHSPDKTFGESCWDALTPEYRELLQEANDDYIANVYRYWSGKDIQTVEEDTVAVAIMVEFDRRGLVASD